MKLEGSLETFPLRELIEMVIYSSVTGVLNIFGAGEAGHLYFRDGTLYHAERGASTGAQGLSEVMELSQAHFAFVSDAETDEASLWGSLSQHLQTAERLVARWRQIRAYIPTLDLIPTLVVERDVALRRITPTHHTVLDVLDGQASLRDLALTLGWAEIDVSEVIAQFSVDGLVDLHPLQVKVVAADLPAELSLQPLKGKGFFDRVLEQMPPPKPPANPAPAVAAATVSEPEAPVTTPVDTHGQEDLILKLLRG